MSRKQWKNRQLKKAPIRSLPAGCRECGKPLTAAATVKRGMCRSCWRVAKVVTANGT